MKHNHLDPARTVIEKFGGVHAVSLATGKSISRVYRWMYPRQRGGTDGLIPNVDAAKILADARERKIRLSPADFFPSASSDASSEAAA